MSEGLVLYPQTACGGRLPETPQSRSNDMPSVFILPQDIRHGEHLHCVSGIRRFCERTGIDFEQLMKGKITSDELRKTGQYMGIETAENAENRVSRSRE